MLCVSEKKKNKKIPFQMKRRRNTAYERDIAVSFQVCPAEDAADRQRMRSQLNRQCFLLQKCNLLPPGSERYVFCCLFIDKAGKPIYN